MYRAIDVAKWFVTIFSEEGKILTKDKISQLCFIAQGVHLSVYREALFSDSVQAWPHGVAINMLHQQLPKHKPIVREILIFQQSFGIVLDDFETLEILNLVWNQFKNHSAFILSEWMRRESSAWSIAYHQEGGQCILAYEISHDLIIQEFDSFVISQKRSRLTRPGL
ncbi:DUF4065 domain-containing protein [Thiotrichales bacterium 19X7-9]|nr:DUF4065 domain-containing protein [Thiotrichales bacterium 19X7-9]